MTDTIEQLKKPSPEFQKKYVKYHEVAIEQPKKKASDFTQYADRGLGYWLFVAADMFRRHLSGPPYYVHNQPSYGLWFALKWQAANLFGAVMKHAWRVFNYAGWRLSKRDTKANIERKNEICLECPFLARKPYASASLKLCSLCGCPERPESEVTNKNQRVWPHCPAGFHPGSAQWPKAFRGVGCTTCGSKK